MLKLYYQCLLAMYVVRLIMYGVTFMSEIAPADVDCRPHFLCPHMHKFTIRVMVQAGVQAAVSIPDVSCACAEELDVFLR